jgi:hypothetical protein
VKRIDKYSYDYIHADWLESNIYDLNNMLMETNPTKQQMIIFEKLIEILLDLRCEIKENSK